MEGLITGRLPNALSEVDYKLEDYRCAKMCPSTGVTPNSMVLMEMLLQILRMMLFSVSLFLSSLMTLVALKSAIIEQKYFKARL